MFGRFIASEFLSRKTNNPLNTSNRSKANDRIALTEPFLLIAVHYCLIDTVDAQNITHWNCL
jgi:hypothetical protein